jgi:pimeloyl-ACP methyl ester carboxylesterase
MRLLNWIARGIVALIVLAVFAYPLADWLRAPLDEAARAELLRSGKADQFVRLSAGVMHVRVRGPADGQAVLLVHGASVGGYAYAKWIAPLADAGYRVIVPDLFGYGYSERPDGPYTKAFYMSQLAELLDALAEKGPVHIVGSSMGGVVVTGFTAGAPARVRSVTLIAPAGLGKVEAAASTPLAPVVGDWVFRVLCPAASVSRVPMAFERTADREGMTAWMNEQARFRGWCESQLNTFRNYNILWQPEDYDALGRAALPVLAAWGTADATVPFAHSEELLKRVPQAKLVRYEGKGHTLTFGETEAVLAVVLPFLKASDGASGEGQSEAAATGSSK